MSEWMKLPNPFLNVVDNAEVITGHVSGRYTDIVEIITGSQSAIILAGAPQIGKTTLLRYLQRSPETKAGWSWRDELASIRKEFHLDKVHFVPVDLTGLEEIETKEQVLKSFIKVCVDALYTTYQPKGAKEQIQLNFKGLHALLQNITTGGRCFLVIDSLHNLGHYYLRTGAESSIRFELPAQYTSQEIGLVLLHVSKVLSTLVELLDTLSNASVLLSLESLPRPTIEQQFSRLSPDISAELSRFSTMVLKTCAWKDTKAFLEQKCESFEAGWATRFRDLGGNEIFSAKEQEWLRTQAGSHPYLLHQFSWQAFRMKQELADLYDTWAELQESDKARLTERVYESVSTFLNSLWKRVHEALDSSTLATKTRFSEFVNLLKQNHPPDAVIDGKIWHNFGKELRNILQSEGIMRDEPGGIHLPGMLLSNYIVQKSKEDSNWLATPAPTPSNVRGVHITRPESPADFLPLSEIEYLLIKALLQPPHHFTEEDLKQAAWTQHISSKAFSQRMHHLRRKMKERCDTEIIENRYGGRYLLNHPEWFALTQ